MGIACGNIARAYLSLKKEFDVCLQKGFVLILYIDTESMDMARGVYTSIDQYPNMPQSSNWMLCNDGNLFYMPKNPHDFFGTRVWGTLKDDVAANMYITVRYAVREFEEDFDAVKQHASDGKELIVWAAQCVTCGKTVGVTGGACKWCKADAMMESLLEEENEPPKPKKTKKKKKRGLCKPAPVIQAELFCIIESIEVLESIGFVFNDILRP